jgi:hypothetical protein
MDEDGIHPIHATTHRHQLMCATFSVAVADVLFSHPCQPSACASLVTPGTERQGHASSVFTLVLGKAATLLQLHAGSISDGEQELNLEGPDGEGI